MASKYITLTETIPLKNSIIAKQKRIGFKRFVKKIFSGWKQSGDPKIQAGVDVKVVIDRENKKYDQVVKDAKTGKVLHEDHELLNEHKTKGKD